MLLSHVLIIDATDRLGWLAGRLLADLGADVIKLEPPGSDRSRAEWRAFNVNKRILELDPEPASARSRVEELLRTADICLLTPAASIPGLDPLALRRDYPRLVVVAIRPFGDVVGIEPTRAGAFMTGRSIKGARYRVFWPCRDGYINFIFYGGAAGRRTNEQLVAWMRQSGAELRALAAIDWKTWDPTKADQAEVDAIEAPVAEFFARLTKREFLTEGHRREML